MADMPRWVDKWDLDSQAMLSAYLTYIKDVRESLEKGNPALSYQPIFEGHLFSIIHHQPDWVERVNAKPLPLPGVPERWCAARDCHRCYARGGTSFAGTARTGRTCTTRESGRALGRLRSQSSPSLTFATSSGGSMCVCGTRFQPRIVFQELSARNPLALCCQASVGARTEKSSPDIYMYTCFPFSDSMYVFRSLMWRRSFQRCNRSFLEAR